EGDKGGGREMRRRLAARRAAAIRGRLALIGEAFGEGAAEALCRAIRVIGVVAAALSGKLDAERVVDVVVPLRGVEPVREIAGAVVVVLEDEMDGTILDPGAHGGRELGQDVGIGIVEDRVDGVEAEPVDVELLEPVERVLDEEVADRAALRAVEVDPVAPGRAVAPGEELRVGAEIVPLGSEVVVDDVEEKGEAARVAG